MPFAEARDDCREFARVARGFCQWCEGPANALTDNRAVYWLARVHSQAAILIEVGCENAEGLPDLPADALEKAKANLAPFWGRYYRTCFDPSPESLDEPTMGDLGDDLLDTYRDIRAGLLLFDADQEREALWHWSFLHRIHWGRHAAGALYALQCLSLSRLD